MNTCNNLESNPGKYGSKLQYNIIGIESQNSKLNATINLMTIRFVIYVCKGEINCINEKHIGFTVALLYPFATSLARG
jgi:hypothetical protein